MSMIKFPPIIVLIKELCPGQSTNVRINPSMFFSFSFSGASIDNAENPRSSVIPANEFKINECLLDF